ncbi:ATP-dependent helicase [Ruania zhangjianzhongii]|uniref:ATP-dependent helicase n=1 Tax=Ruania zhangjianzhongii TaxID=2603206 RepID=UPI0011C74DE9|nr:ATP-dependent DNA helicase [Ruania zhangjianzhongii]
MSQHAGTPAGADWTAAAIAEALGQPPPTDEQRVVVEAELEPMLVVAGAGSGKTETMAARVVYLVANQRVRPSEILGLTFTRKAASELSVRIRSRLRRLSRAGVISTDAVEDQPRIATYNSYAAGIVTDHALRIGIDPDATLIGDAGRYQLADDLVQTWAEDLETTSAVSTVVDAVAALAAELSEHGRSPQEAAAEIDRLIQTILDKEDEPGKKPGVRAAVLKVVGSLRTRLQLMDLVAAFGARKRADGVVDFGDQVRLAATIAAQVDDVGAGERSRYRAVLLDEYQDTSIAQVQMLRALFGAGHPVTAVGDPNQAIYGWRGAAAGTLLDFPDTFPGAAGPARSVNLSTAWRNDLAVLHAANHLAAPLRSGAVAPLVPRPGAGPGRVQARYLETHLEEAEHIADYLAPRWSPEGFSAAVLCRRRAQFVAVEQALTAAGLPCQVVGLAGLLSTPEVSDLRAALQVAHDPSRGDAMMRLLTGPSVNLGAADLRVLADWARSQAKSWARPSSADSAAEPDAGEEVPQVREAVEEASLVEAVDRLPKAGWQSPRGRSLSEVATSRLQRLARAIRQVRSLTHLSVPELITATEQALELDMEVLAATPGSAGHARRHLDAFTAAGADFAGSADSPTLSAFLTYLDVAEDEERGLEVVEAEPDSRAIQIMTVHAAKGLEWDCVVVAGMNMGDFPSLQHTPAEGKPVTSGGWLSPIGTLPYFLRGDAASLPELAVEEAGTHTEMESALEAFRLDEGQRLLREERRLAYVALTRARHDLLLTGSFWVNQIRPKRPSPFLVELLDAGLVELAALPAQSQYESNPAGAAARVAAWPEPEAAIGRQWEQLWPDPRTASLPGVSEQAQDWWRDAELLLAERDRAGAQAPDRPAHLSASAVVALAQDQTAFQRGRRRPVPHQPSVQARRGTRFHAWVEQYFGSRALLDWEDLPGADDDLSGEDAALAELQRAFLASDWATATPVGVEVDIETPVRSVMVRCRIDAVFAASDGGVHIVDWKTGAPPRDTRTLRARQMQLALYRLAWSRLHAQPLEMIQASFVYVGAGESISSGTITEAEIDEVLATVT